MAKKNFKNLGNEDGGKSTLSILIDGANNQTKSTEVKAVEPKKDWYPQTFNVYKKDYIFFQRYSRYMALRNDEKYNLMRCFNDAMDLLREKYPDIEP